MTSRMMNRRCALRTGLTAALALNPALRVLAGDQQRLFKIGACDWSLGKRQDTAALELARQIGLDGVEVSFGSPGGEYDLRKEDARQAYLRKSAACGVEIASLAMGILNQRPYASDPEAERWVADCVDVMPEMNQRVVLLAFFSAGDIKGKPAAQQSVIRRLKQIAPKAEQAGVVLGIESWLNAEEHLRILDAVGSSAVQVYYDVANMHKQGYDIYRELRTLGRDRICQVHAKENGFLLGTGRIDFAKVKAALDDIGWNGWLIIEGATVSGKSRVECHTANQKYLRSVFPTAT